MFLQEKPVLTIGPKVHKAPRSLTHPTSHIKSKRSDQRPSQGRCGAEAPLKHRLQRHCQILSGILANYLACASGTEQETTRLIKYHAA